ncbi:MAG: alpha-E domain-containing protein [Minwuia sp.]|uniref:alpha-E domain-containing protein n=1 Tax=Minwuia sp. TaxID=2493630 RepID=UPI003A879FE0
MPGLTQAARQGSVGLVNALGSGIVEQPGLMPFLPGLCRQMLGEELRLSSVDTWWCGQPVERTHVCNRLEDMVVKPAFPPEPGEPVFGPYLDDSQRQDLLKSISERPESHVGQELIRLSTAPTWSEHGLEPRSIMLRMLLCWTPSGWTVMPGGMVRVAPDRRERVVSMQRGGGAKDVWVVGAPGPGETRRDRPKARQVAIRRESTNITSRAAENLYWFGRYLERALGLTRRVRGALRNVDQRLFPLATGAESDVVHGLLGSGVFRMGEADDMSLRELMSRAGAMFSDTEHPNGLANVFNRLRQSADGLRYMMSGDSWLAVTRVQDAMESARQAAASGLLLADRVDDVVYALQALSGSLQDTMPRGHGWRFHEVGRRLELSLQMVDLLAATLLQPEARSPVVLSTVLDITDCSAAYHERYRDDTDLATVLDLLISDERHPRSLAYQLERLTEYITHLSELRETLPGEDRHVAIRTLAAVQLADAHELAVEDGDGTRPRLEQLLEILQGHLPRLDGAVSSRYFTHVEGRGRQRAIGHSEIIEGVT